MMTMKYQTTMRDYLKNPCQTNLELYEQMLESSNYTQQDIELVHEAYFFSLPKVNGLYRGSGKPFICHLVGTCSILVALNCSVEVLLSGMMHALYQNRVNFDGELSIENRRIILTEKFGRPVDGLIADYTEFEMVHINQIKLNESNRPVILMRLADTLEDLAGEALFFRGNPNDDGAVKGSFENYFTFYKEHIEQLVLLSNLAEAPKLGHCFTFWLNEVTYKNYPTSMRKGYYSSFALN